MSEQKYLSDGRKVVVIGKLNNQETIVQEVFVTESGDEVPSGERFVVKSLHDEPVISYKEKQVKSAEIGLAKIKKEIKTAEEKMNDKISRLKGISEIIASSEKLAQHLDSDELKIFSLFATGMIKYLVFDEYTITPPVEMLGKIINYESRYGEKHFDGVRLLSLLGKSEGKLEYNINRYRDGSGSWETVTPYCTLEEALEHIKNRAEFLIDEGRLRKDSYDNCIDMGIKFSKEYFEKYKAIRIKAINESREYNNKQIVQAQDKLKQLDDEVDNLKH